MTDAKKTELESHLLRAQRQVDAWPAAKRRSRIEYLKTQLMQNGMTIDDEIRGAMERFASGNSGFDELSRIFQEKFTHDWN